MRRFSWGQLRPAVQVRQLRPSTSSRNPTFSYSVCKIMNHRRRPRPPQASQYLCCRGSHPKSRLGFSKGPKGCSNSSLLDLLNNLTQGAAAPPAPDAPRFYGFRILGQTQVADPELKKQLASLFGTKDNFEAPKTNCLYPELGFSFGPGPGSPSNDFLVSFSCNQVQSRSFPWPYPYTGMTSNTVSDLTQIVKKLWPGG